MSQPRWRRIATNIAVVVVSSVLFIAVGELLLRMAHFVPPDDRHYVWAPNYEASFQPIPEVLVGIHGESRVKANSQGIRGDELGPDAGLRILAIGGSTTECLYLDQSETWPARLQEDLAQTLPGHRVWVGNAGRSGLNTREHIFQLRHLLVELPDLDAVVFLIGINDLGLKLRQDTEHDPHELDRPGADREYMNRAFALHPDRDVAWYKRTAIYHIARRIKWRLDDSQTDAVDTEGRLYQTWRQQRIQATNIRTELPDLTDALDEYQRNVNELIDIGESHGVRLIFLTQPTTWKAGLAKDIEALMTGGRGRSEDEFYAVDALAKGIELYNQKLIEVCKARGVEYFDIASLLPKDASIFFDDSHYNESGAEKFASVLADYLQRQPWLQASAVP